jgi:hypothetical protein
MSSPSKRRLTRLGLALSALLVGAGVAVVPAPAAHAAIGCDFTFVSLKARNLDRDNGRASDFVFLQVDQTWFPAGNDGVEFELGATHFAGLFGNPVMGFGAGGLEIRLVLDKFPANHTVDTDTIACAAVTNAVNQFSDGDAIYDMTYSVTT